MVRAMICLMVWLGSLALAALFFTMLTGSLLVITISALENKEPYYHAQ